jgi:hypothetical protein
MVKRKAEAAPREQARQEDLDPLSSVVYIGCVSFQCFNHILRLSINVDTALCIASTYLPPSQLRSHYRHIPHGFYEKQMKGKDLYIHLKCIQGIQGAASINV